MDLKLYYGENVLNLEIPNEKVKSILETQPLQVTENENILIEKAMKTPIDSLQLSEIVKRGEKVCIIIGDVTRLWVKHHLMIPFILSELNKGGVLDDDIFIISATGDHRKQTPEEHIQLVGDNVYSRIEVIDHQARVKNDMIYIGTTSFGTPVSINKRVYEADRVILTGGIVYHFLAGWGGGRKAILPGISAYETIMKNHSLAFLPQEAEGLNPAVCCGRLIGNPCNEDMLEAAAFVKPDFLVNTVIDERTNKIANVFAGNYLTAYNQGCDYVRKNCGLKINEPSEMVIASCGGYPKDINFYQTYKTIYNAEKALKKGGTLLLISESREGVGSDDFYNVFTDYKDNRQRGLALRNKYTIGGHMGFHVALIAEENDLLVLSSLPDATIKNMGMIPIKSLEDGLSWVRNKYCGIPECYVMPHGGSTLPYYSSSEFS